MHRCTMAIPLYPFAQVSQKPMIGLKKTEVGGARWRPCGKAELLVQDDDGKSGGIGPTVV